MMKVRIGLVSVTPPAQLVETTQFVKPKPRSSTRPQSFSTINPWRVQQNYFTTNSTGQGTLVVNSSNPFFRLLAVDVSTNTPLGYTNLLNSYGLMSTLIVVTNEVIQRV